MKSENVNVVEIKTTKTTTSIAKSTNIINASNKSTTEIKYPLAQLTAVSNEREFKVCTTSEQKPNQPTTTNIDAASFTVYHNNTKKYGVKGYQENKSLAERKAQLRAEFFQNKLPTKVNTSLKSTIEKDKFKYFPKVQYLLEKFERPQINLYEKTMIVNNMSASENALKLAKGSIQKQLHSPLSDEGCNLAQSPYSSDDDNESIRTASTTIERSFKRKEKVTRSASSDSALGLEVDETPNTEFKAKRRMTLTVTDLPLRAALLPLAEPTALPVTTAPLQLQQTLLTQTAIPSKLLLEERMVELPMDETVASPILASRRESAQSCISDYQLSESGANAVRYMRTPSVVVSDYSDDVMCGITLEEIEYFRAQRVGRRCSSLDTTGNDRDCGGGVDVHSDVSAASSCSNLYYCGSTISALDGTECFINGERLPLKRKTSDTSNYYTVSGDNCEDSLTPTPQTNNEETDLANLLLAKIDLDAKVQATNKKVGRTPVVVVSRADN